MSLIACVSRLNVISFLPTTDFLACLRRAFSAAISSLRRASSSLRNNTLLLAPFFLALVCIKIAASCFFLSCFRADFPLADACIFVEAVRRAVICFPVSFLVIFPLALLCILAAAASCESSWRRACVSAPKLLSALPVAFFFAFLSRAFSSAISFLRLVSLSLLI